MINPKKLFILFAAILLLTGCKNKEPVSATAFVLNTVATITIYKFEGAGTPQTAIDEAFTLCGEYESRFSRTIPESEIAGINAAGGEAVPISQDTRELLMRSLEFCQLSGGAFDITLGGLSDLWNFTGANPHAPDAVAIAEALSHTGYGKLQIREEWASLADPETVIDLGGIAKGYIADRLGLFLREKGVSSGIIDLGGNILLIGGKPEGGGTKDFSVGIADPDYSSSGTLGVFSLQNKSIVTSGGYQRFFVENGKTYHHILDPKTGSSAESGLLSVTIVSDDSAEGDALSTACFVLGAEEGLRLIESLDGVEAVFIKEDGEAVYSSGIGASVKFDLQRS